MDQQEQLKNLMAFGTAVGKLKDKLKAGFKKAGKANFGAIFSEAQLMDFLNDHTDIISFTWVPNQSKVDNLTTGGYLAQSKALVIATFKNDDDTTGTFVIEPDGVASDRNDAAFALGKAMTYTKRYFFTKLLDLAGEDIEPENADVMKKELMQSVKTRFDELDDEVKTRYLTRLKTATGAGSIAQLVDVANLQEANALMDKLITALKAKEAK